MFLPVVSKIIQHILKDQIIHHCSNYICDSQFASLAGLSFRIWVIGSTQFVIMTSNRIFWLLFILYVNYIPEHTNFLNCRTFMFADDIILLISGRSASPVICQNNINCCLRNEVEWTIRNSLSINSSKSKAVLFRSTFKRSVIIQRFIHMFKIIEYNY